mgnify:CR=1 FL=1
MDDGDVYDMVVDRGHILISLAASVDTTEDDDARALLLAYMRKVVASVPVPKGELVVLDGGVDGSKT